MSLKLSERQYLGVQFDCSLNWREQIKAVSAKVFRVAGFLKHAKSFVRQETLQTLYRGIVESYFRYSCSVWGCPSLAEIDQLLKLQNRAARIIKNSNHDAPSRYLIERLGLNTVSELTAIESNTMRP